METILPIAIKELPIPPVKVPEYKVGVFGDWVVRVAEVPKKLAGYFTLEPVQPATTYTLSRRDPETGSFVVWMSFTAMELESHAIHIAAASGSVVVAGLGMGMYLYNILPKEQVTSVVVLERDPDVIKLFKEVSGYEDWEGVSKLRIVESDACAPTSEALEAAGGCDYLYADIWADIASEEALADTVKMCELYKPKSVGYWCCEFDVITAAMELKLPIMMLQSGMFDLPLEKNINDKGIPLHTFDTHKRLRLPSYSRYCAYAGVILAMQTV